MARGWHGRKRSVHNVRKKRNANRNTKQAQCFLVASVCFLPLSCDSGHRCHFRCFTRRFLSHQPFAVDSDPSGPKLSHAREKQLRRCRPIHKVCGPGSFFGRSTKPPRVAIIRIIGCPDISGHFGASHRRFFPVTGGFSLRIFRPDFWTQTPARHHGPCHHGSLNQVNSSQLLYSADRRSDSLGHETSSSDPPSRIMSRPAERMR